MVTTLIGVTLSVATIGLILIFLIWQKSKQPLGQNLDQALREELRIARDESSRQARELREEVAAAQVQATAVLVQTVNTLGESQKALLGQLAKEVQASAESSRTALEAQRDKIQLQLQGIQKANADSFNEVRVTLDGKLRQMMAEQKSQLAEVVTALKDLGKAHAQEQEKALGVLDKKFQQIQEGNEKKLDEMRQTVDEKLHNTLEKRLSESFQLVSTQLAQVHTGLGEVHSLAAGVGDLKRLLTNVKERGTWGEYQLEAILKEILTVDQFARNVHVQETGEVVEFAVKLPGKGTDQDRPVWLPIDSKFPKEDYERLVAASAAADKDGVESATSALLGRVEGMAKDIRNKYIVPPQTTNFAILFLPTEGLYAEVLRQPGFHDKLQQEYKVMVAGPTTLSAILSSLRVGFQTLAIEKRADEVWNVLGAVKTEFGKFGAVLAKVKKQLNTAANTIAQTEARTRAMKRQLISVEQLPVAEAAVLLELVDDPPQLEQGEAGDDESEPTSDTTGTEQKV